MRVPIIKHNHHPAGSDDSTRTERKTSIVAEGGGLRASYVVGVVKAIVEKFDIATVDVAVATSGSGGTLAYFVAGQLDSISHIWTNLLSTWRFLGFRNLLLGNPFLNVDYLIDTVFKKEEPLDIEILKNKPTELYVAVTNYDTGDERCFSNHDDVDFFEVLRATKALEIFYGRPVEIAGQRFVDGALSCPIGIAKALEAGATDIIVVSTRPRGFQRSRSLFERLMTAVFARRCPESLRQRLAEYPDTYNSLMDMMRKEIEKAERNIILIQPETKVAAGKLQNSREKLFESIDQGYRDTCRHEELRFFGK